MAKNYRDVAIEQPSLFILKGSSGLSVPLHDQPLRLDYNRSRPNVQRNRLPGHNKSYSLRLETLSRRAALLVALPFVLQRASTLVSCNFH